MGPMTSRMLTQRTVASRPGACRAATTCPSKVRGRFRCLDRGLVHWERQFYHAVPWPLTREELCDAAERITVA